ncbi:WASP-like-associated protein, partial [Varanus komodoensis]
MDADTSKNEDCTTQQAAKVSPGQPSTHSTTDENMVPSGWVNSTNDSSSELLTSVHASSISNMLGREGDLGYPQAFLNAKPLHYVANFIPAPHLLPPTQAEVFPARKNDETMKIPRSAAAAAVAAPLTTQEGIVYQTKEQIPGEQEQIMRVQMEQLQRLVTEQQKIITFYNPASGPENLPCVAEENGEDQIDENASFSPFGQRMNMRTQNADDRPIRPGIGVKQKTFQEFVEEQLKFDSERMGKQKQ